MTLESGLVLLTQPPPAEGGKFANLAASFLADLESFSTELSSRIAMTESDEEDVVCELEGNNRESSALRLHVSRQNFTSSSESFFGGLSLSFAIIVLNLCFAAASEEEDDAASIIFTTLSYRAASSTNSGKVNSPGLLMIISTRTSCPHDANVSDEY